MEDTWSKDKGDKTIYSVVKCNSLPRNADCGLCKIFILCFWQVHLAPRNGFCTGFRQTK